MRRVPLCSTAVALCVATSALSAQTGGFSSAAGMTFAMPTGETRDFVTAPSWIGLSWEGRWDLTPHVQTVGGLEFQDFYSSSFTTTNFASGAATGQQVRDLIAVNVMAGLRYYPLPQRSHRPYISLGAGGVYTGQYFQLGLSQINHDDFTPAIAPEIGLEIPYVDDIGAVVALRYTLPTHAVHIGGGARSFQYLTLVLAVVER